MGFYSLPSCALQGCGWPSIVKIQHVENEEPVTAFLCIWHIFRARECVAEMTALQRQDKELLGHDDTSEPR